MNGNLKAPSSESIDILIVIDTEYIKNYYPRNTDPNNPLEIDQNSQFMVAHNPRGIISGQSTTDLSLKVKTGDWFAFRTVSIQQNSDDAVLIYRMEHCSGENIFGSFRLDGSIRRKAVQPNVRLYDVLPVSFNEQFFSSFVAQIRKKDGKEKLSACIAVYILDQSGNTQELYGYYCFNLQITAPL